MRHKEEKSKLGKNKIKDKFNFYKKMHLPYFFRKTTSTTQKNLPINAKSLW